MLKLDKSQFIRLPTISQVVVWLNEKRIINLAQSLSYTINFSLTSGGVVRVDRKVVPIDVYRGFMVRLTDDS